jgi:hypothetical protein
MNEETQKRVIMMTSTALAGLLSSKVADKLIQVPEERGVKDDLKEAILKAGFSVISTVVASIIIRQLLGRR